jgi:TetR/AcrR family transcriptional repressor of lmrAB and yxaGH operons
MIEAASRLLRRDGYNNGCPVAVIALEVAPESAQLADACASELANWTNRLARAIACAGFSPQHSDEVATVIVSGLEGALLMARLSQETRALTVTANAMASLLQLQPR